MNTEECMKIFRKQTELRRVKIRKKETIHDLEIISKSKKMWMATQQMKARNDSYHITKNNATASIHF